MICEEIQNRLSEFIDNELDFESSLIIKEHIEECEVCFREIESIRRLKQQLASLVPSLSKDFDLKLQESISNANSVTGPKNSFRKVLPIAASIVLIVPLVYYLTFQPPANVQNKFIIELQSIGKVVSNDNNNFHKWTQLDPSGEVFECSSSISGSYCSLDLD